MNKLNSFIFSEAHFDQNVENRNSIFHRRKQDFLIRHVHLGRESGRKILNGHFSEQ